MRDTEPGHIPGPVGDRDRAGRVGAAAIATLVVCCAGHILLLTGGIAGLAAVAGAVVSSAGLLVLAAVLAVGVAAVGVRRRRRSRRCTHSERTLR